MLGGFAWGTSFLWIKIALEEIGPFMLVAYRLVFGVAALWLILWARGVKLPREKRFLWTMIFLGALNTAIPVTLVAWGEKYVDSGLTGILVATVPLFTILLAHLFLADERITLPKSLGLMVGFLGITLLLSQDIDLGGLSNSLIGQTAMVVAAMFYAISSVFVRRFLRGQPALLISAISLTSAMVILWIVTPLVEGPFTMPQDPLTWIAVVWLGLFGTTLAYLLYFFLLNAWGPTRSTTITYVFPVVAVTLGIIFLGEKVDWRLLVGGALVIGGIAVVNRRVG